MTLGVDAALVRLEAARERFGDFKALFLSSARIAARAGKTEIAISVLSDASVKWPDDAEILEESARQHEVKEDWPAALRLYQAIRTGHPHSPAGYLGEARIRARLGASDVAEAIIAEGLKRFPQDVRLYVASAEIAMQRNDWRAAIERWQEAERRSPGDAGIANRLQAARLAALEGDPTDLGRSPDGKDPLRDDSVLMMQFESLGGADHQGCEFGLIQRAFGAEPLGLFRWTSIEPAMLVQALRTRFASVGQRETTRIDVREFENRQEYATIDTRLDAFTHNFLFADEISRERAEAMIFTRLKFLTRKLIADLEAGEKIFVYRLVSRNLEPAELDALHRAMRGYGENTLLYVRYQDDDHPAGTVEVRGDGLMIGYMDRFGFTRSGERLAPSTQSWRAVCRAAYQAWQRDGGA